LLVKGVAGSPYAIKDYFDVDPDLAENVEKRMEEFEALVKRCHRNDLKVIIDFVPNHVYRQYKSNNKVQSIPNLGEYDDIGVNFAPNNNFYYLNGTSFQIPEGINFPYTAQSQEYIETPAKVTGNNVFSNRPSINDWYETVKLNYGIDYQNYEQKYFYPLPNTWQRMYEILHFWASKGIDGFRVDMAEMVPVEFWKWVIEMLKAEYKSIIFIAEVYNPSLYRNFIFDCNFDYLYDKEEFYNYVRAIISNSASARLLTQCWQQQEGLSSYLLRFLENHDEQRIASKYFAGDSKKAIPAMIVAATMHQGPLMLYFGQEIGEDATESEGYSGFDGRTTIFDYWKINKYQKWIDAGNFNIKNLATEQQFIRNFYCQMLKLRLKYSEILNGAFYDLMWLNNNNLDSDKVFIYLRFNDNKALLVVVNFDINNSHNFTLNMTAHTFDFMKLLLENEISFKSVYGDNKEFKLKVQEIINNGINISLEPNSGKIFEMGWG